jgi:hypothetical protein
MQSKAAKKKERGELVENVFGPPGQDGGAGFESTDAAPPAREREPRRWPMSESSRLILEAAVEAAELEAERHQKAEQARQARIVRAMQLDGLPELGDDFFGANRKGDEWVEVTAEELARQSQRR